MNRLDLALRVRWLASPRRPEALVRDVLYAFRTFRRAPFAALTIVLTVALGLGLVTLVFGVYSKFFLHVDAVWKPGELYGVDRPAHAGSEAWLPFTRPEEIEARHNVHARNAGKMGLREEVFLTEGPASPDALSEIAQTFFVWNEDVRQYFGHTLVSGSAA
jgi:hypothetical protein